MSDCLWAAFAPLVGALLAGLSTPWSMRRFAHFVTIGAVAVSAYFSLMILYALHQGAEPLHQVLYTWAQCGTLSMEVGFWVDKLTALMMVVVTSVSLMVHIYTIGYMKDDPGYQRFFALISLFTFAMLMLVMANNFLQLFFGWEAVGLVSYLLIGFWYQKESAVFANLKAFLVNRVGDFGFLLGIALVVWCYGSLDYQTVFNNLGSSLPVQYVYSLDVKTTTALLLFVGAMGKSAQVPLHVWLPDSMEGPTPISALIHAATMVTAGVFMVARLSPLFEIAPTALSVILILGATTCFFMGLLGLVQNDIKRVVAYSTLSQLGYMVTGLGASAYALSVYHLMTHAFFKALLFLGCGSVIIALHHEQDMRKMGGLWKKMPITFLTMLIGTIALVGFPGTSGFYSKDLLIEAVHASALPGAQWAYWAVLSSVFVTSLYSFRLLYLVFLGTPRMSADQYAHAKESPWVVWLPLALLAVPSLTIGYLTVDPWMAGWLGKATSVAASHTAMQTVAHHFTSAQAMLMQGFVHTPFFLLMAGFVVATLAYRIIPSMPSLVAQTLRPLHRLLQEKYYFDWVYQNLFARAIRSLGWSLWRLIDDGLIDGLLVNGSARLAGGLGQRIRQIQSGYIYHYVFAMILGVVAILFFFAWNLIR